MKPPSNIVCECSVIKEEEAVDKDKDVEEDGVVHKEEKSTQEIPERKICCVCSSAENVM